MPLQLDNEHHASGDVEKAARKVLKDLQQEYIDLFLIHWPVVKNCKGDTLKPSIKVVIFLVTHVFNGVVSRKPGKSAVKITVQETWQAMEKLVDEGLVKSIGISNFSVEKIKVCGPYFAIPTSTACWARWYRLKSSAAGAGMGFF